MANAGTATALEATRSRAELLFSPFARISWGAIIAGLFLIIAVQSVLSLLGVGIGLSTVRPSDPQNPSVEALSLGAALWWIASNWTALVIGGYVASRLAQGANAVDGILHGFVTWALALVVAIVLLAGAVSAGIGAAANVAGAVMPRPAAMASGASQGEGGVTAAARQLLRRQDPASMSDEAAAAEVGAGAARILAGDKDVDRDRLAQIIGAKAQISPDEAKQRLTEWEQAARQQAKVAADRAVQIGRSVSIWTFVVVIIGAIGACLGGWIGAAHSAEGARVVRTRETLTVGEAERR
jgi:hypothetical protein